MYIWVIVLCYKDRLMEEMYFAKQNNLLQNFKTIFTYI